MDNFEMKIIKDKNIVKFETKISDNEISKLTVSSHNKKEIKRYLKKFF